MAERDPADLASVESADSPELALALPPVSATESRTAGLGRFLVGVGVFSVVQAVVQALGLGAGILWVRALPTGEYALYTLANSVLALAAVLTDLGAGSALQHFFHRHRGESEALGRYLAAVRSLRRVLALAVLPVLLVLLASQVRGEPEVSRSSAMAVLVAVVVACLVQQETTIRLVSLRLLGRWPTVYRSEVTLAALRLAGAAVALVARTASVIWALTANLLASVAATLVAKPATARPPAGVRNERREVLRYLAPIVPDTVYYAIQGQLVVWLAALAGSPTQVAQIGALTRIGLLFAVPQNLAANYLVPKLAGRHADGDFRTATLRYGAFVGLMAAGAMGVAWLWPGPFLALLGSRYEGLEQELQLVVAGGALGLLGTFFAQVNRTRGWTRSLWGIIAGTVAGQLVYVLRVPLTSTVNVLGLGVVAAAVLTVGHGWATAYGFRKSRRTETGLGR